MKGIFHPVIKIFLLSVLVIGTIFSQKAIGQSGTISIEDSIMQKFSVEDLVKLKKMLEEEKQRLIQKQEKDLQRGINLSQEFLNKSKEENENQDLILIRVAEYYIEEADAEFQDKVEAFNRQYDAYENQYKAYQEGKLKAEPKAPVYPIKNYDQAIAIYDLILTKFPESDLADDALYNKAYLVEQMGEESNARQIYQELIDKYPEGNYAPEAYMHLAEFYFQPKIGQDREETIRNLNKAAQLYKNVLQYKDSPRYDEALYKLGWSYYRLAAEDPFYYNDAILYFTMVVQDIEKFQKIDPQGKYIKSNIQPEAIQYLAASFVDTSYTSDGVAKAKNYFEKLDLPDFGKIFFSDMGDLYTKIVDYNNAIDSYATLLELYPDYSRAPMINKKIADVYLLDQKPQEAFKQREILFESFNPKSEWYGEQEKSEAPDHLEVLNQTYQITEEALRSNLIYELDVAKNAEAAKGDSLSAYQKFSDLAHMYIQTFPTDEHAYEINWSLAYVLDTELKDYTQAFNEYIRVSNDYLESQHREDAANNAIAVAQTLSNQTTAMVDTAQISGMDMSQMAPRQLTKEQEMLAEAYDNYIKLFPGNDRTATYLANAGALYYQHGQFDQARKYYKTMVTKFPESQQRTIGLVSLMNSYFFLGKYKDSEFVAKKIVENAGLPEDQLKVARDRIGESIYKNAERLEQEGNYREAAQEFYRVFSDARDNTRIVDLALLNSGKNYEKAGEWALAIQVYDSLITNYDNSSYRLIALGKTADDYKQMENYKGVAKTYERIYSLYPLGEDAEAALYNASLFFAKAESWSDAIRINNKYIEKYPQKTESKDLLFENARYYLKLNDLNSANRIYDEFAKRYEDDPRTIEAFYRRGEYYFDNNQYDLARQEFQNAINRSDQFSKTGRDPNLFYASEAYFKLGEIEFAAFQKIQLTYPEATLRAQLRQKQDKLLAVVDAFTKVIKMGSIKGFEAMYKVAQAYEEMAAAIANQTLAPNLTPEQALVERDRVFKASVPAYDRAVEEYKNVIKNIPVYSEKLEVSIFDAPSDTLLEESDSGDTTFAVKKETLQDSTREIALKWYHQAEDQVSLILYNVADRSSEFIDAYLRQKSPVSGLKYLSYKKLLLERAVAPAVNVTINAHLKNIQISEQLNLDNKYVRESKRKILLTNDILGDEYGKLFRSATEIYRDEIPQLIELVNAGEDATNAEGLNSMDYNGQVLNTIDYINEFLNTAMNQYKNTLKFADDHEIKNDAVLTTQDRLLTLAYDSGTRLLDLSGEAVANRDYYDSTSIATADPRYQLGIVYFDDQQSVLKDYALNVLESSYQIGKDYEIKNIWTNLILSKLIVLDPVQYMGDIPREKLVINSDTTWRDSKEYALDWAQPDYDDSQWKSAQKVILPADMYFTLFTPSGQNPAAIWITANRPASNDTTSGKMTLPDSVISDSSMMAHTDVMDSLGTVDTTAMGGPRSLELQDKEMMEPGMASQSSSDSTFATGNQIGDTLTVYFRRHFTLPSRPVEGRIFITGDDDYHLYLNGEYIKGDNKRIFTDVDTVGFVALGDFLKTGDNTIAVDVTDYDGPPGYGLRFYMELETLPAEVTAAAERIRKETAKNIDKQQLKMVSILNKNKIVKQ